MQQQAPLHHKVILQVCLCLCTLWLSQPIVAADNTTTKKTTSKRSTKTSKKPAPPKAEAAQSNLEEIQGKIQALSSAITASKQARQDADEALKASESAISTSRKALREIQEEQAENREQLSELQQKMRGLEHRVRQQQSIVSQQLNQQYRHGQNSPLQMWLQQQDPADTQRNLKYLGYLTAAHQQQVNTLQKTRQQLNSVREETASQLQETERLAKQHSETTHKLEHEKTQRAQALAQISKQIESQEQQLNRLKRDEEALSQLVLKLVAEAKKRQQEAEARALREKQKRAQALAKKKTSPDPSTRKNGRTFEHTDEASVDSNDSGSNTTVIAKNEVLPEPGMSQVRFSQLRGKLRLPVRGEVINRFGSARADTGVNWKGLFIRASAGSEVKAIAGGQIVFSDWMRGFGNLIVIDHGEGYMSLYGNNEALFKASGDRVRPGETIASVGNSGGNPDNGVYYELRRNSVPMDPLQWSSVR